MSEQFQNGWWQVDGIAPEPNHHHDQSRSVNGWTLYNDIGLNQNDCRLIACKGGDVKVAEFFGGWNKFQIVGNTIFLVSEWQQGHYVNRFRDLVGCIFNGDFVTASIPLMIPTVFNKCLWIKIGSGADIVGAPPNDPGGWLADFRFEGPGVLRWETETLNLDGALVETRAWRRTIDLATSVMSPIEDLGPV